jgi:uncharacterized protein (UPF0335 family)
MIYQYLASQYLLKRLTMAHYFKICDQAKAEATSRAGHVSLTGATYVIKPGAWRIARSRDLLSLCVSFTLVEVALFPHSTMSMRTRRKSKQAAAAAAAAAEPDIEPTGSVASLDGTAGPSRVEFSIPIPDDLDLEYLSRLLPDVSFDTPSSDSVLSLYRLVLSQAVDLDGVVRDLEESRAENERKDVELDQALQDRESSASSLEVQVKALQEELEKVKQERNALGESRAMFLIGFRATLYSLFSSLIRFFFSQASSKSNLESHISTLNSSQSISSTELDSFKHKVEGIEREKRDLLGVVSRLKEDSAQRDGVFAISFTCRLYTN